MKSEQISKSTKFLKKNAAKRLRKLNKKLRNRAQRRVPICEVPNRGYKGWIS